MSTDGLRSIADDLDESGDELAGFVLLAAVKAGDGRETVRVMSSGSDNDAAILALRQGIRLLQGGAEQ